MSDTLSSSTVYDKAKYHYEGDFPTDLPREQAYVFAGFFLGWIVDREMYSDDALHHYSGHIEDFKQSEYGEYLYHFMEQFDCDPSIYHVEDNWDNYFHMGQAIDSEYEYWLENVR